MNIFDLKIGKAFLLFMTFTMVACNPERDNPLDPEGVNYDQSQVSSTEGTSSSDAVDDLPELFDIINGKREMSGHISQDYQVGSDTKYSLKGMVYVDSGVTLYIKGGANIVAKDSSSGLTVLPGATIAADGSIGGDWIYFLPPKESLIETDEDYWKGVTIMGYASLNSDNGRGIIDEEEDHFFGGELDDDSSGVFKYVHIYGAGQQDGSGLRLAGVGSRTDIRYISIHSNKTTGVELYGGKVNLSYIVTQYSFGTSLYVHSGYQGQLSNYICRQPFTGNRCITLSGATDNREPTKLRMSQSTLIKSQDNEQPMIQLKDQVILQAEGTVFNLDNQNLVFEVDQAASQFIVNDSTRFTNSYYQGSYTNLISSGVSSNTSTKAFSWLEESQGSFNANGFSLKQTSEPAQAGSGAHVYGDVWGAGWDVNLNSSPSNF